MSEEPARSSGIVPDPRFDRPVLIVSPPRSGSTLLFETIEQAPALYSTGFESHGIIERLPGFHPASRQWESNRLTAEDAQTPSARQFAEDFYGQLRDRDGRRAAGPMRALEKTPKNALRIPFFNALWPDALFVYLYRDVRQTLGSMMEAWASGHFRTYPRLPGWAGYPWSLLLIPGWRELIGKPLPEIVAHQWATTTHTMLDDLAAVPPERLRVVEYDRFLAAPEVTVAALARSLDLEWDRKLGGNLPLSKTTVSQPRTDKWRRLQAPIEAVLPIVADADARARELLARFGG